MAREKGLTVIELMLVISVLMIMLAVGLPAMRDFVDRARLTTASNDLLSAIHYTRSEAVKRGHRVTLCASHDQLACSPDADWHDGWIVFSDPVAAGQPDGVVIRSGPGYGAPTVTGNQPVRRYVSYMADGSTRLASGALQMGTITVCLRGEARRIVINRAGRPRTAVGAC